MISSTLAFLASVALAISGFFGGLIHPVATIPPETQAAAVALPAGVSDTITITNASGTAQANYPYQFGRPFVQGEIKGFPQVLINGSAVQTQADVKNRYPDGSVKFAVISVIVPNIPTSGTVTLSFQNQSSGNNAPLSTSQMLDSKYDFDSQIKLTSGGATKSASARAMLQDGNYTYWAQGPVATTIVLQDNSTARKYDLGFDSLRPIHPQFEATFWPSLNKVSVRATGMNANTSAVEDITADLAITLGDASPQTVYSKAGVVMYGGSGWTKQFWIGGIPEQKINIDNNIAYLAATNYLPNFDVSSLKTLYPESAIAGDYSNWLTKPRDLYDAGGWVRYMPTTGGRSDIGLYTTWDMQSLITGDWRYRAMALGQANLAAAWPWNFVEGDSAAKYDQAQTVSALGLPVSIYAHPTTWLYNSNGKNAFIQGTRATPKNPWTVENAHQPEPFSVSYMTTGDPFYLDELQNWAASAALDYAICDTITPNCSSLRSANPVVAGIKGQIRGDAWTIRTRARAGIFSVDGTPEQKYFTGITTDALIAWEAYHRIPDPAAANTATYKKIYADLSIDPSPLHFFGPGQNGTETGIWSEALWQDYYLLLSLGQAKEFGYPAGTLITWFSKVLTEQFNQMPPNGTYEIKLLGQYYSPVQAENKYLTDWEQVQAVLGADTTANTVKAFNNSSDYAVLGAGAAAMIANEPGGAVAWNWLNTNVRAAPNSSKFYRQEPSWNLLPRSVADIPLPPPVFGPAASTTPVIPATTTPATTTPPQTGTGVSISAISITGDYTLSANPCSGTIAMGRTCTLSVVFKPTAAGIRKGTLTFTETASKTQHSVVLTGTGVAKPADAEPTNPAPPATSPTTTLVGTEGNDRLTLAKNVAAVDGKGGFDTAYLGFVGKDSNPTWYAITKNNDGSYTAFDGHASGYQVTLSHVEELLWPNGQSVMLGAASGSNTDSNPHNADILGTDNSDNLTAKGNGHVVDGKGGYDTVRFESGNSQLSSSWVSVKKNKDGSYTVQHVHASGYKITLWNVEAVSFPRGSAIILANVKVSLLDSFIDSVWRAKLGFELAFQSAGTSIRLALSGGPTTTAAVSLSLTPVNLDFGSVPIGSSASKTITITASQK